MIPRFTGKELTKFLRQIAAEAQTLSDEGDTVTKAEALAKLLWMKALGYVEDRRGDDGKVKQIIHTPESWAIQLIYERLEGKVAPSAGEEGGKISAAEKVSDLNRNRINAMAGAGATKKTLPPKLPKKKQE